MAKKAMGALAHVQAAARQGLTVAEYARRNGVSAQSLYSARRDVARRQKRPAQGRGASAFAAVEVVGVSGSVQAQLPNGVTLSFSGSDVAGFVATLAGLACSR